ncbi:MAG: hypothetical protein QMA93_02060, partial [Acidimicrobiales bacterium]
CQRTTTPSRSIPILQDRPTTVRARPGDDEIRVLEPTTNSTRAEWPQLQLAYRRFCHWTDPHPPVHMGRIAVDWPVGRPHDWRVLFTAPLKFEPWLCHLDPLLRPTPVNSREQSNHLQVSDQKSDCRAWITRHPK